MEYPHNEQTKSTEEQKVNYLIYLGCVCWDVDDLTDDELEKMEAA